MPGSSEPDLGEVAAVLRRRLPSAGWHAWLFGSRATGRATQRSDWDIGILGPAPLRGAVLEAVREELETLRTLDTFDVVDLARVPERFRRVALADAVELL